jgi:hypothetical protein
VRIVRDGRLTVPVMVASGSHMKSAIAKTGFTPEVGQQTETVAPSTLQ